MYRQTAAHVHAHELTDLLTLTLALAQRGAEGDIALLLQRPQVIPQISSLKVVSPRDMPAL